MPGRMGTTGANTLIKTLTRTRSQVDSLPESAEKGLIAEVLRELDAFLELKCTVPGHAEDLADQLPGLTVKATDGGANGKCIVEVTSSVQEELVDEMEELLVALRSDVKAWDVAEPTLSAMSSRVAIGRSSQIRECIVNALKGLEGSWPTDVPENVRSLLDDVVRQTRKQLADLQNYQTKQRAWAGVDEIEDLVRQLQETLRDGNEAVAKLGEGELAKDFGVLAKHEGWESRAWQFFVAVVLSGMAWIAFEHVAVITDLTWVQALQKLTVSVPLAALAVFAGAEAKVHRHRGMWARSMAVQLRTVGAFTAVLPEQEKVELRMALGRRVFDEPSVPPRKRSETTSADVDAAALVRSIADLAGDGAQSLAFRKRTDTKPDDAATNS